MKFAIVTCYKQNDYIRARTLRAALAKCPDVDSIVVRNRHTGWLRYPEVALKLAKLRLVDRPDTYFITFRGYEIMLLMTLTFVRKPIIFDEFINFTEWMEEHGRIRQGSLAYRVFRHWYGWLVRRSRLVTTDTDAHASYSAILNKLSIDFYRVIPVNADETVFKPQVDTKRPEGPFTVLYYGSMLPLHGLDHVLRTALLLKDNPKIAFRVIGGKRRVAEACAQAAADGARISYDSWLPFDKLPAAIAQAGLTLGGPFGDTLQSRFVVTGKTYQVLACAAPVVIGRNEVNEGFTDRLNCLTVAQADPEALAETITWASGHPQELRKIGQAGRQFYEKQFSQAVINELVEDMVGELRHGAR
jgi:glycosyltransferase involved in cell wall biosynthesis